MAYRYILVEFAFYPGGKMKKRILYGVANYEEIVAENGYFIDKTRYIPRLEIIKNPVFLRPRRFGKSLWCRILECYYSIRMKDRFDELFGHTWIGQNPTALKNAFIVLHLDFSTVEEPAAVLNLYVIYCFGNQGFRVFDVTEVVS